MAMRYTIWSLLATAGLLYGCISNYIIESQFRVLDSDKVIKMVYKEDNPAVRKEGMLTIYSSARLVLFVYGTDATIRIEGNYSSLPLEDPWQYPQEFSLVSPEWRIDFVKPQSGDIIHVKNVRRTEGRKP